MIDFYLVDVKNINSNIPRSSFSDNDIENLANMILESGGIIKPLILKQTGVEEYSVVDGHFEYYAAVKAREKNPRQGEMVNAFIIKDNVESLVTNQINFLNDCSYSKPSVDDSSKIIENQTLKQNNYSYIDKQISELRVDVLREIEKLSYMINSSSLNKKQEQLSILEMFNKLSIKDLVYRLKIVNFSENKAIEIAEKIEKERKKPFDSLNDVVNRVILTQKKGKSRAITEARMLKIVDTWSSISFK